MYAASTIVLFILLWASVVQASCHLYLVPEIRVGNVRRPDIEVVNRASMDFGFQPVFLTAADVSSSVDEKIAARSDVIRLPDNLDGTIGGGLSNIQTKLEAINIPAGWV